MHSYLVKLEVKQYSLCLSGTIFSVHKYLYTASFQDNDTISGVLRILGKQTIWNVNENVPMFFSEPVQAPMVHWGNWPNAIIRSVLPSAKTQLLWLISISRTLTYLNLSKMPWEEIFLTCQTQLLLGKTWQFLLTIVLWSVISNKIPFGLSTSTFKGGGNSL